ncbi:MAG: hypothetical protein H3C62_04645 [Gemmatimonadaceae bacterium]|nr:hypothetical protein [Gemmatimonadaceae bacterium]
MTVQITVPDGRCIAPLYHRFDGQVRAQPAYLVIDPGARAAWWDWNDDVGNVVPWAVWHHRQFRVPCSNTLSRAQLASLSDDATVCMLVDRVCDGYTESSDGKRGVGCLSDDAVAARDTLADLLAGVAGAVLVCDARVWLGESAPARATAESLMALAESAGVLLLDVDRVLTAESEDGEQDAAGE